MSAIKLDTVPKSNQHIVCIGGGPAGLTAAYLLSSRGISVTVLESDPEYLGGISKTVSYKGFCCDIGGHRFFSKSDEVTKLWNEILDEGFIQRPRKSRIYYQNKFFDYPLKATNALFNLGILESALCVLSYLKACLFPVNNPAHFEAWVCNKFGRRLFSIFFKSYTEKVWGMKCTDISADWAMQRIKGLSLWSAVKNMLFPGASSSDGAVIKTLIDSFHYPRKGPGMMWESAAQKITQQNGVIKMGHTVTGLRLLQQDASLDKGEVRWEVISQDSAGVETRHTADHVISSAPIMELIQRIAPEPAPAVIVAASSLQYRDFLVVGLIVNDRNIFDDNWIYIHDPSVKVGRIQNFKSWSPEMVPNPDKNCYGMEYFCFEDDDIWSRQDTDLIELACSELVQLNLAHLSDITDGFVVRQKKAYPVYDSTYADNVDIVRYAIKAHYPGLHLVGRNGMHKYNNQDHAMMTAMLTVENIVAGSDLYDVWKVNQDAEYHEQETRADSGGRMVPERTQSKLRT